jgi:hypothetical protein
MKQLQGGLTSIFLDEAAIESFPKYINLGIILDPNSKIYLAVGTNTNCKLYTTEGFFNEIIKEPGKEFNLQELTRFHDYRTLWELDEHDYLPDEVFYTWAYGNLDNHYWVIGELIEDSNEIYYVIQNDNHLRFFEDKELITELTVPEGTNTAEYLKSKNLQVICPGT